MGGRHGGWNEKWRIKYSKYYGSKKKKTKEVFFAFGVEINPPGW